MPPPTMTEPLSTTVAADAPQLVNLEICDHGDMVISLQTSEMHASFLVSSHLLCTSSQVFRAMFGSKSNFSEAVALRASKSASSPNDLYRLEVSEHDPTALAVVLYALHARADRIPETIAFEELMKVAYVCDYYDCAASMRTWVDAWMEQWREHVQKPGYEGWLFLAWAFKNQEVFETLTEKFSRGAVFDEGVFGTVVKTDPREVARMDEHLPQAIIDAMADRRINACKVITRACRDLYDTYDDDSQQKCARASRSSKDCDRFVFGGLHKGFQKLHLLSHSDEEKLSGLSVSEIVGQVKEFILELKAKQQDEISYNGTKHTGCHTFDSILTKLDDTLATFKPMHLSDFEKMPASVSVAWENLLARYSNNPAEKGKPDEKDSGLAGEGTPVET